jgi:hypothetical protein
MTPVLIAAVVAVATGTDVLSSLALLGTIIAAAVLFGGAVVKAFAWHAKRAVERSQLDEVLLTLKKTGKGPDVSVGDVLEHHGEILGQIQTDYVTQAAHTILTESIVAVDSKVEHIETELVSFQRETVVQRENAEAGIKTIHEQIASIVDSVSGLALGVKGLEGGIQSLVQEYRVQKAHTDAAEAGVAAQLIVQLEQAKNYVTRNEFVALAESIKRIELIDQAQLEGQKNFVTQTQLAVLTEVVRRLEVVLTNAIANQVVSGEQARVELVHRAEESEQVKVVAQETVVARRDMTHRLDALEGPAARAVEKQQHVQDNRIEGLESEPVVDPAVATQERIDSAKVKPFRDAKGHFQKS